jgi:hypothetical protein
LKITLIADPALAERPGGLRAQLYETHAALAEVGKQLAIEASLALPHGVTELRCDVLHVFGTSAATGRATASAAVRRVPVVLSPRLSPAWNRSNGVRARVSDRLLSNGSACDLDSGYAQIRRALNGAALVLASSEAERKAICDAFLLPAERVDLVPHGVAARFFDADPGPFRARFGLAGPFALMVGQIAPYADQFGVAQALAALSIPLVVIGQARERDAHYLHALRRLRSVTCLDALPHDDPLLASAFAAASVLVHTDLCSGGALACAQALAAGTPVVKAGVDERTSLQSTIRALLAMPPARETVRAMANPTSWASVATQLAACYRRVLAASR